MKKTIIGFGLVLGLSTGAQATPLDLSTFSIDGDVTVNGGMVTIDEASMGWGSYFVDDSFGVGADTLSLSFDYELSSTIDDYDWLVAIINDGVNNIYDLEVTGTNIGTYIMDLTAYQNSTISLSFGLEADWSDWAYGSVASFSNFDLTTSGGTGTQAPVPEPATMLLFGTGIAGLVGARRRKKIAV